MKKQSREFEGGGLTANPATLVKAKPEHNARVRFLSGEEETKLLTVLSAIWPEHLPAFLLSIHTGRRASEQFQLKWRDVSFERRMISLPKTKTGKARHIPLNTIALHAIEERKQAQDKFESSQRVNGAARSGQAYVFHNANGETRSTITDAGSMRRWRKPGSKTTQPPARYSRRRLPRWYLCFMRTPTFTHTMFGDTAAIVACVVLWVNCKSVSTL